MIIQQYFAVDIDGVVRYIVTGAIQDIALITISSLTTIKIIKGTTKKNWQQLTIADTVTLLFKESTKMVDRPLLLVQTYIYGDSMLRKVRVT